MWLCVVSTALTTTELAPLLGQRQSSSARRAVEVAIASLLPPTPLDLHPTQLNGRWKLLWSSQTADVNPFATPDEVLGGSCIQEIDLNEDRYGRLSNIVQWAPQWRLVGGAAVSPVADGPTARSVLSVDSVIIMLGGALFDFSLSQLAKLSTPRASAHQYQ